MSLWNKIVLGVKFAMGGFESATDYLLSLLNKYLASGSVPERIQKAREYVSMVLYYLRKYQEYCPEKWAEDYEKLLVAMETLNEVFADNQVTFGEIEKAIADIKAAIETWMKD